MRNQTDVVVIGGGYAGVMAANRLTKNPDLTIRLINPRPRFVERIRLHQLVTGSDDAVADYEDMLADRVQLVVDHVDRINPAARRVELSSGTTLGYDHLIYAVGSHSSPTTSGVAEFAHPLTTLEEADRLRAALDAAGPHAAVTVVGGGASGMETATELAEAGRRVTLVCGGELGPTLHPRGRAHVARRMAALGITVIDGPGSQVTAVSDAEVSLVDGRAIPSAVTVWTAGFGVPDLARRSGLSTDADGRLRTDETLTSVDDASIVAAGDCASPSGIGFRMSCQTATQLGLLAADTVLSRVAGQEPSAVSVGVVSLCLSLGRSDGLLQLTHRDDSPRRLLVPGQRGAAIKETVCSGTVKALAFEGRHPGLIRFPDWLADPERQRQLLARHDEVSITP